MNILQINASDSMVGGASRVAMDLTDSFLNAGHQVSLFVGKKFTHRSYVQQINKPVYSRLLSLILANDIDFFNTDHILESDQFKKADIVQCHNLHGWFFNLQTLLQMCRLKPVVWTLHDMWAVTPHCSHAYEGQLKSGFYQCPSLKIYPSLLWHNEKYLVSRKREIYNQADFTVITPSQWLEMKIADSVLSGKSRKLIYNGVDTRVFKAHDKNAARDFFCLPKDKKIILFLSPGGKKNQFKGGDQMQKISRLFFHRQDILFVCAGGSEPRHENRNVLFLPKIEDKTDLAKLYSASDCLLFVSLADNFPLVVLESLACGLPVVSYKVGGVPEAITHLKQGYIASYKCIEDLVEGVNWVLALNDTGLASLRNNCIARAKENFSLDLMAKQYLNLYRDLLRRNNF